MSACLPIVVIFADRFWGHRRDLKARTSRDSRSLRGAPPHRPLWSDRSAGMGETPETLKAAANALFKGERLSVFPRPLRFEGFSIRGFDDLTAPLPRVPQSTSTPRRSRRTAARWRYHPTTPSSCPTAPSHTSDWRTTAAPSKMRPKPSSRTRTTSRRTTAAGRRSTRSGTSPMPSRTSRRCAGCSRRTGTGA